MHKRPSRTDPGSWLSILLPAWLSTEPRLADPLTTCWWECLTGGYYSGVRSPGQSLGLPPGSPHRGWQGLGVTKKPGGPEEAAPLPQSGCRTVRWGLPLGGGWQPCPCVHVVNTRLAGPCPSSAACAPAGGGSTHLLAQNKRPPSLAPLRTHFSHVILRRKCAHGTHRGVITFAAITLESDVQLSHVQLFAIPWTVARQTPLSVESSSQEYWSG